MPIHDVPTLPSALETLYGGQFTFSTESIKANYLVMPPIAPTKHHSFFRIHHIKWKHLDRLDACKHT